MKIHIKGHSGCKLDILEKKKTWIIRKSTQDKNFLDRLEKQANKQDYFFKSNKFPFIRIPQIYNKAKTPVSFSFDMEYFKSENFISFFEHSSKSDVDMILRHILAFVEENLNLSKMVEIDSRQITSKFNELEETLLSAEQTSILFSKYSDKINLVFDSLPPQLCLPMGSCHGDLTLSNILFNRTDNSLVLIDFLDSFIESPLMDMVKIRQDTKFKWSYNLAEKPFDKTRVTMIMDYLDIKFHEHFNQFEFYKNFSELVEIYREVDGWIKGNV